MKLRLPIVLLSLALLGCPPAGPADFRALAEKAYPEGGTPDRPAMDALWSALFKLPKWHFLMSAQSAQSKQPAAVQINGEAWLLVFTDLDMLNLYAAANKTLVDGGTIPDAGPQFVFNVSPTAPVIQPPVADAGEAGNAGAPLATVSPHLSSDGKPLFVSMSPAEARAFLAAWAGPPVAGIRFNEGTRKGWFAPLKAISNIQDMLKANGKI